MNHTPPGEPVATFSMIQQRDVSLGATKSATSGQWPGGVGHRQQRAGLLPWILVAGLLSPVVMAHDPGPQGCDGETAQSQGAEARPIGNPGDVGKTSPVAAGRGPPVGEDQVERAGAHPPGTEALAAQVADLLRQLESPRRQVRAEAERRLLELGPAVLPWLPDRRELASESVRGVVARLRPLLHERAARDATKPSHLELRGRRTLREWCAEVFRQTGNRVVCDTLSEADQNEVLAGDLMEGPFWPTFADFWQPTNWSWRLDREAAALRIERRPPDEPRMEPLAVTWSGVHRLSLDRVHWKERANASPLVRVRVRVTAEPRVRHLLWQFRDGVQQGVIVEPCGREVALKPFSPESQRELPPGGGDAEMQFDFEGPQRRAGQRLRLAVEVVALAAPVEVPLRFGELGELVNALEPRPRRQRAGGVEVALERVSLIEAGPETGTAVIRMAVLYNQGGTVFESYRNWILHNEAWLERTPGDSVRRETASEPTFEPDGRVGMAYRFVGLKGPMDLGTFVYNAPALMIELPARGILDCEPTE